MGSSEAGGFGLGDGGGVGVAVGGGYDGFVAALVEREVVDFLAAQSVYVALDHWVVAYSLWARCFSWTFVQQLGLIAVPILLFVFRAGGCAPASGYAVRKSDGLCRCCIQLLYSRLLL